MMPLAYAFLERGDDVTWGVAAEMCPRIEAAGFAARPAGLGREESSRIFEERFPVLPELPPARRPDVMFPGLFGAVRAGPMLDDLLPVARGLRPTLIVSEAGEFAGPIVAGVLGVPCVTHAFGALTPGHRVEAAAEAVAPLWEANGLAPRPYGGRYDHLYISIYPPNLGATIGHHVGAVQLLRPDTVVTGEDETLPDWLGDREGSPVVYVTFGTVFNTDLALFETVIDAMRELDVRVVVTVGPQGEPEVFGHVPDNIHVARYVPQTQLLPRCRAVVSHAGSGTFLAALALGLPQLCLPLAADQFLNAANGASAGAAIDLDSDDRGTDRIRAAVQRLLTDPDLAAGAAKVRDDIAAMPGPAQVADAIEDRFGG
jgi:hypothetical protein